VSRHVAQRINKTLLYILHNEGLLVDDTKGSLSNFLFKF
jgi:hypothetical protein